MVYCGGGRVDYTPVTLQDAEKSRQAAVKLWQTASLPYDHLTVPDEKIQAVFDSSIRNIWQAREIRTACWRSRLARRAIAMLWIVDGAFILESATILGAGDQARAGIAYELTFQQPDGRFEILPRFYKENGIVLWTVDAARGSRKIRRGCAASGRKWKSRSHSSSRLRKEPASLSREI